jgi:hypothetical protein
MSGGGLIQIVAYGAQDIFLTADPEITFWKLQYRRHTNFATESIEQTFNGNADFGKKVSATIARNGDLMYRATLVVELPEIEPTVSGCWTHDVGHHLINTVDFEVGGQRIDRHWGDWLQIWSSLTVPDSQKVTYYKMIGRTEQLCGYNTNVKPRTTLYIPLQFYFNRFAGCALPLIALQYHEVKINVEFRPIELLWCCANDSGYLDDNVRRRNMLSCSLWVDYVFLDTDERRKFAQISHEYLIDQLQYTEESINNPSVRLTYTFNHPSQELIWVVQKDSHIGHPGMSVSNQWSNYQLDAFDMNTPFAMFEGAHYGGFGGNMSTTHGESVGSRDGNPVVYYKLQLNNHDRFAGREGSYFNLEQIYEHHTSGTQSEGINVYSFALQPEEHQPSCAINFSRIDKAVGSLQVHQGTLLSVNPETHEQCVTAAKVRTYCRSKNIFRVLSGMGGVAYSS